MRIQFNQNKVIAKKQTRILRNIIKIIRKKGWFNKRFYIFNDLSLVVYKSGTVDFYQNNDFLTIENYKGSK